MNKPSERASWSARSYGMVAAALLASGLVYLACVQLSLNAQHDYEAPFVGLTEGTTLGIACAAAIWSGLGPGKLFYRLPLSLSVTLAVVAARAINIYSHDEKSEFWLVWPIALALVVMWLFAQAYFGALRLATGLTLIKLASNPMSEGRDRSRTLSIRDLLRMTLLISIPLGLYRLAASFSTFRDFYDIRPSTLTIIESLSVLGIGLLLVYALLLRRFWIASTLLLVAVIAIWSSFEDLVVYHYGAWRVVSGIANGAYWCNGFCAAWIIAYGLLVRLAGYRIARK